MTPSREEDVKSIARRNWRAVIQRSMKDPTRRDYYSGMYRSSYST